MNIDQVRAYFLALPFSEQTFPFGPDVEVFKVKGKMFATLSDSKEHPSTNLKCDPHEALLLREMFSAVLPGYHMNKKHWNTVILDSTIPKGELERMIDNSFYLVVAKLSKKVQQSILSSL